MATPPKLPTTDKPAVTVSSGARRRVLRGSLAAGPVLMTVLSRPVLGTQGCGGSINTSIKAGTSLHPECQ